MTGNFEALRKTVEANSSTNTRRLSDKLDIPQTSVIPHLLKLGKVYRPCREILHDLTEN